MKAIARDGADAFYRGWIADDIVRRLRAEGSLHTREDFARHRGDYAAPISTGYRGTRVWECPPPGQGLTALLLLNILAESSAGRGPAVRRSLPHPDRGEQAGLRRARPAYRRPASTSACR